MVARRSFAKLVLLNSRYDDKVKKKNVKSEKGSDNNNEKASKEEGKKKKTNKRTLLDYVAERGRKQGGGWVGGRWKERERRQK